MDRIAAIITADVVMICEPVTPIFRPRSPDAIPPRQGREKRRKNMIKKKYSKIYNEIVVLTFFSFEREIDPRSR